jgi:RimJ/RimL family protein N-acetyltransferase
MNPIYKTDRLILRPRSLADLEDCVAMDLDPEVVKYIRSTEDEETHRAFLKERFKLSFGDGLGFWSALLKKEDGSSGEFIGWVLLIPLADAGPEVEIGYKFVQRAWGKGYASEAASAIRDHAFLQTDLEEIVAVTHPENRASQNVLKKIGLFRRGEKFAYGETLPFFTLGKERWQELSAS